jgi:hypothetical protein
MPVYMGRGLKLVRESGPLHPPPRHRGPVWAEGERAMTSAPPVRFGNPAEWEEFARRNAPFIAVWNDYRPFIDQVFSRAFDTDKSIDRVVFTLGRLTVEDFMEILLVVGNGYGGAGLKLLRSMFERMITMMYLIRHPDEVENFLGFHWVHLRKTVNHLRAVGGDPATYYSAAELEDLEIQYQSVRSRYEVFCECDRSRGLPAWTKRDMATLTRDVGLEATYLTLNLWPTFQIVQPLYSLKTGG